MSRLFSLLLTLVIVAIWRRSHRLFFFRACPLLEPDYLFWLGCLAHWWKARPSTQKASWVISGLYFTFLVSWHRLRAMWRLVVSERSHVHLRHLETVLIDDVEHKGLRFFLSRGCPLGRAFFIWWPFFERGELLAKREISVLVVLLQLLFLYFRHIETLHVLI
jgi:hypothetical protein